MKKITQITAFFVALLFAAGASAGVISVSGDGSEMSLQEVIDSLGNTQVSVANDQIEGDELWVIGASGGSTAVVVIELAGNAGGNTFGIYDASDHTDKVELFSGAATAGSAVQFTLKPSGVYLCAPQNIGGACGAETVFSANLFGFYLQGPGGTFYSQMGLNGGADQMVSFVGVGETITLPGNFAGPWAANEYILAWEDLNAANGGDYNDFVVFVESVSPVPAPGTLALLGLGLAGLGASRRKA